LPPFLSLFFHIILSSFLSPFLFSFALIISSNSVGRTSPSPPSSLLSHLQQPALSPFFLYLPPLPPLSPLIISSSCISSPLLLFSLFSPIVFFSFLHP